MHRGWIVTGFVTATVVIVTAITWADTTPDFSFRSQQASAMDAPTQTQATRPSQQHLQSELAAAGSDPAAAVALAELAAWDQARAQAWALGDTRALRALYVPGTVAGQEDLRLLRRYRQRGLRVEGMQMQVLAVDELTVSKRRLRIRVTDRLVGAVAVDNTGARQALPQSLPRTRSLTLVATASGWQMAAVQGE